MTEYQRRWPCAVNVCYFYLGIIFFDKPEIRVVEKNLHGNLIKVQEVELRRHDPTVYSGVNAFHDVDDKKNDHCHLAES